MWGGSDELIEMLRDTPVILRTLVTGIDAEAARSAPSEREWSIVEVAAHLADAEERAAERIRTITGDNDPVLEGYDQVALAERRGYRRMALEDVLARFERLRAERLALLESLPTEAWGRTGRHVDQGVLSLHQLTAHMCKHDVAHLAQIARMVGEPG